jgi:hypothetical protein
MLIYFLSFNALSGRLGKRRAALYSKPITKSTSRGIDPVRASDVEDTVAGKLVRIRSLITKAGELRCNVEAS